MRYWLCLGLLMGCGASAATEVEVAFPEGKSQLAVPADSITWRKCPPTLPQGCEMAVLEGDPRQAQLFTVRFRTTGVFEMKPHSHPRNERVTILEGRVGVGFGDSIDRSVVSWFGPGDYYVNAKETVHFVLADSPALIQITGIGPWEANFIDGN